MATNQIVMRSAADISLTLRLGSNKATGAGVGNKAKMLDQAAAAGLPVPAGYILLDDVWQLALQQDLLKFDENGVTCPDADGLFNALNLPAFSSGVKVAVRSAFTIEDNPSKSMAGHFASIVGVDPANPKALIDALCSVWASSVQYDEIRRDVLIMQMVDAKFAGVLFTESNYEDDRVNFVEGTAEKLLAGEIEGDVANLTRLRPFEKAPAEEGVNRGDATWRDRLQALMRRVRGRFGDGNWDVEWADDGTTCYLLQIRPITVPPRRNEAFTLANHKEILPELPSRYMVSIIEACSADLYEWYRQFDKSLPQHRPFIEVFKGRPYINLSLLTETMRALGLPTNLVTDNIGGDAINKSGFNFKRVIAKLPTLAQLGMSQMNAVDSAEETGRIITERTQFPGDTFSEVNTTLRWTYTTLVHEMFNLTQAMSLSLATLRRTNKLAEMAAATRTISTQIYDDLLPLREYVKENPKLLPAVKAGNLPDDPEFKRRWGLYLAKHGHRGIYESDIARPRFHEAPSSLLVTLADDSSIAAPTVKTDTKLNRAARQAQAAIVAREQLRYSAMRSFDRIRKRILELAADAVKAGQIPDVESIWMLSIDEAALLDVGWKPGQSFFEARKAEIAALEKYSMPDLLHRFDNLEEYHPDVNRREKVLKGMSLVDGTVKGKAWILREPSTDLPEGFSPQNTILVARSVDAGWIPTFTKVAGVVVETGGDLSHGSIIIRELGIPSITNVKNATHALQNGDDLILNGGNGTVQKG